MRILQLLDSDYLPRLAHRQGSGAFSIIEGHVSLVERVASLDGTGATLRDSLLDDPVEAVVDARELEAAGFRIARPIEGLDPERITITGTGLTHLGSAKSRDGMHAEEPETLTDSMKMFRKGLEGGKPAPGEWGVQPEWFYKGDGSMLVAPGEPLAGPSFALDHGEEPEVAGIYLNDARGVPGRIGFALGNEFSDHVMEKENYLYLAHSKIRPCSVGPEVLLGEFPGEIEGTSRIRRGGDVLWEKPFRTGEDHMSHSLENLERHHFKYSQFRRPGAVHVHFFGTATLSFADGVRLEAGDIMEISSPTFGLPLENPLEILPEFEPTVRRW